MVYDSDIERLRPVQKDRIADKSGQKQFQIRDRTGQPLRPILSAGPVSHEWIETDTRHHLRMDVHYNYTI